MGIRTGRIAVLGAWLTAGALCFASSAQAQSITVGNATGDPGATVSVSVTLSSGTAMVAGTQNDIAFSAPIAVAAKANGKPDCAVNPDIGKGATSFAFRPNGCTGTACTSVRALVLATDNVDPIPDGSVMYTCNVAIAADAAGGDYTLAITGVILSDPNGAQIPGATGNNGTVTVTGGAEPTATPTTAPVVCNAPAIQISTSTVDPGTTTTSITATLLTGTAMVAGSQNDITFTSPIAIAAKANGKPDCAVNPDIGKGATSFAFRPNGCTGTACTSVRALVLATDNVDPIPDGSVLYTCNVAIDAGAVNGTYPLATTGVILSDPNGNQVPGASGCEGGVIIGGGGGETPTPTPTTAPIACLAPAIQVESKTVDPGTTSTTVTATLLTGNAVVAGSQNDIGFAAPIAIAAKANGKPDCAVNPDIGKGATSFAFRPNGCTGTACTSVRALVLATDNVDPIPDGSVLYTCNVTIAEGASGTSSLPVTGVILSDPNGNQVPGVTGCDGSITVGGVVPGTPTPTPTVTVTPTSTSPPPPTNTPTVTPTNTVKPTSTPTTGAPTPAPFDDDGGCNISTTGSSSAGWLVLIPAIGLLVMRRRRR
jgi:MYXO-CTERM domain-containing protein